MDDILKPFSPESLYQSQPNLAHALFSKAIFSLFQLWAMYFSKRNKNGMAKIAIDWQNSKSVPRQQLG